MAYLQYKITIMLRAKNANQLHRLMFATAAGNLTAHGRIRSRVLGTQSMIQRRKK